MVQKFSTAAVEYHVCVLRCSELVQKFSTAAVSLQVATNCCTVENAAQSAVSLIGEFLLRVCVVFVIL